MDFNILEDWDSFEEIVRLLCFYFKAEVIDRSDGPESKFITLKIEGTELRLVNNPYGNFLRASTVASKKVLKEISVNWYKYSKL